MKKLYFSIVALYSIYSFCQDKVITTSFPDALRAHLAKYNQKVNYAYERNDVNTSKILFDSLVQFHLKGTHFEDYTFKTFEKRKLQLSSIQKPIFILTYASWCVPSKGEFQALNKLAEKHAKDIKFILLFWDKRKNIKEIARKFNNNIEVCYANESYKNDAPIVAHLKHTLGFPTSYFLDEKLKVIDIKRGGAHPLPNSSFATALSMNYETFNLGLKSIIIEKKINKSQISDSN
ncbi:TlpA family protein disulfide reductase [Flavobacterium covae]|uniref:TlpA family protein disulfide reductase n=1 Tax=Flavobacterium covae TaxID=2906076 RepID=UPI000B4D6A9A|nr:redoxin domain-containing protein [Flavobacterium covae]QYS90372.1 redoxin domain-containing protein [Flavobacterium covae]